MSDGCVFCRIIAGGIPATLVASNAHGVAFREVLYLAAISRASPAP